MRCCSAIACVTFKKTKATISNLNVLPYFGMVLHNSNIPRSDGVSGVEKLVLILNLPFLAQ